MTSKNETGAWIAHFGNSKSQLTEPETVVRGILKELGYEYRLQEPFKIHPLFRGRPDTSLFIFTIDLFIPELKVCVEVDGIHHRTARQERKTAWRDAQLNANGFKVLHIDAEWTETKELQSQLKPLISKAILELAVNGAQVRRIVA